MNTTSKHFLFRPFPVNIILQRPLPGVTFTGFFIFIFVVLYRPLDAHASALFGYELTMALYAIAAITAALPVIMLIRMHPGFREPEKWTLAKELTAILVIVLVMGLAVYFAAFLLEEPADRWNLHTLINSVTSTALIGILPFLAVTLFNLHFFFSGTTMLSEATLQDANRTGDQVVKIDTPLKKDELSFRTSEFLFAVADGNYVVFHLQTNGSVRREMIRVPISSVEEQLASVPYILRTHRAFLVNLKKVSSASGNALGLRLSIPPSAEHIPVSRSRIKRFRSMYKESR